MFLTGPSAGSEREWARRLRPGISGGSALPLVPPHSYCLARFPAGFRIAGTVTALVSES